MKKALSFFVAVTILVSLVLQTTPVSAAQISASTSTAATSSMTLQGERIYQIMTDRFYDGNPANNATGEALRYQEVTAEDMTYMKGGDWQGIIEKIPYIKGMGYTAIWISPISDPQL